MIGCKRNHSRGCILNMLKPLDSCFGSPYKSELQKSSLEVMKACTSISAVWRLIYFLLRLIFRRWRKPALNTAVTWCSIDMTVSYRTPIFLAVDVLLINSSQTEIRGGGGRWLAFKTTISVLSLFILSMFTVIQASISRKQSSIATLASSAVDDLKVRWQVWQRPEKYDLNHSSAQSTTPKWCERRCERVWWSTVSKAA